MYAAKTLIFYNKFFRAWRERSLKFSGVNSKEINRLAKKLICVDVDERNCVFFHIYTHKMLQFTDSVIILRDNKLKERKNDHGKFLDANANVYGRQAR
jgi:4-hydroxyphenylpyruvate dioxygenase-like putative hemolysin